MKKIFIKTKASFIRGVTFIELVVVISIFALISTVVLFNFSDFSTSLSLQNISQDIALRIAQAQREAVSGKVSTLQGGFGAPIDYVPKYGVYFSSVSSASSDFNQPGKEFIYFQDLPGSGYIDGKYDADQTSGQLATTCSTQSTECLDRTFITTGDRVTSITVDGAVVPEVTIMFKRPFPDAMIYTSAAGGNSQADIEITSPKGVTKHVLVNSLGQISVQ
jgi:prepilin-type N-terminal cleavage/methylation domain-containing protein